MCVETYVVSKVAPTKVLAAPPIPCKWKHTYIVRSCLIYVLYTGSNLWNVVNSFKSDLVYLCNALPARLVNSRSVVLVALAWWYQDSTKPSSAWGNWPSHLQWAWCSYRMSALHACLEKHALPRKSTFQVSSRLLRLEARGGGLTMKSDQIH